MTTSHCGVEIDTGHELSRGRTHADVKGTMGWQPNCHAAVGIEAERFLELLIARISGLG
jgi:inosine-uridine nucleoside N-ribohydrolase